MVNKIDGNNYYDYTKLKNVDIPSTGEKFSLDYKKNEPPSEKKDQKEVSDSEKEKQQAAEKNGVRLELSGSGRTAARDRQGQADAAKTQSIFGQSSLLDTVRTFFTTAVASMKDFFYKIWNDPQPSDVLQDTTDIPKAEDTDAAGGIYNADDALEINAIATRNTTDTGNVDTIDMLLSDTDLVQSYHRDKERLDREIQPYLKSGDLNQVINLLTDNGRKTAARNSTLLTYYDRNGRMTEPNASDRERILYGDRNTRKL